MLDTIPTMALATIAIVCGFGGLIWSADRFVAGAASIAEAFGVAPILIGLTIVSFGTSAPEVMVSLMASIRGAGELAVGNAIGSNIANIGLVLGVTLLISRIPVDIKLLKHESSVLILITLLAGVFLFDNRISRFEGWTLLFLLFPAIWYLAVVKQKDHAPEELIAEDVPHYSPLAAWLWFTIGLIALVISSKVLVWGAETTALHFNVSPLIIGLTVIAIGTSLPELAASVMSALKGHHDIAVGNIVGSNMFNLLAVMSLPGIFNSAAMQEKVFNRDYTVMLGITIIIMAAIAFAILRRGKAAYVGRFTGALLAVLYIGYIIVLAAEQLA